MNEKEPEAAALQASSNDRRPSYAGLFRCIGSQCEDTCCGGWDIPVDKITYEAYRTFPAEKLGSLVSHFVSVIPGSPYDNLYASIHQQEDGSCPFFSGDRLCGIQKEYGPGLLSATCSIYPRSLSMVHGRLEGSLTLSCPEAARAVLLHAGSTEQAGNLFSGDFRTDNALSVRERAGLNEFFYPVQSLIAAVIRDRSRPLWQRLLIVASLCRRLDDLAAAGTHGLAELLARYARDLGQGASAELEQLQPQIETRLEFAIMLSDARCRARDCGKRFRDTFWDFVEGIGSFGGEGPDEDVHRFAAASRNYLTPLLDRHPFMAENYLLNYTYQHLFPFGQTGSNRSIARPIFDEAVLLLTQFSWLMTLLTGVAGRHGQAFSQAHVVTTVQSFSRAVEHAPQILEDVLALAKRRNLDTMEGLAQLLRT